MLLAKDQSYFGRCVIVLKRDCGTLAEVTQEEMLDFLKLVQKYEATFKKEYGAVMFNYSLVSYERCL